MFDWLFGKKPEPSPRVALQPAVAASPPKPPRYHRVFLDPTVDLKAPEPYEDPRYRRTAKADIARKLLANPKANEWLREGNRKRLNDFLLACDIFPESVFLTSSPVSLLEAVCKAYAEHQAVVLAPETVVFTVMQAVARFLREADASRVEPIERKPLTYYFPRPEQPLATLLPMLANDLAKQVVGADPTGHRLMAELSPLSVYRSCPAAFDIALLHAFEHRFQYRAVGYACGLPKVVIEGTGEEWLGIAFMLGEWMKCEELAPIAHWLDTVRQVMVRIARFDPLDAQANAFMRRMVSYKEGGCSPHKVSGWVTNFYPFENDKDVRKDFPVEGGPELVLHDLIKNLHATAQVHVTLEACGDMSGSEFDITLRSGIDVETEAHDKHMSLYRPTLTYGIQAPSDSY